MRIPPAHARRPPRRAPEVQRFPETAEPRPLLGAQRGRLAEGRAEPAEERRQRQDVVAIVGEDARERAGAPAPKPVEVERRDQGAGHVLLTDEAEDVALEGGEPAVVEAAGPHAP